MPAPSWGSPRWVQVQYPLVLRAAGEETVVLDTAGVIEGMTKSHAMEWREGIAPVPDWREEMLLERRGA